MEAAYFDTSVFLAIFNGEANGPAIRALLRELKRDKVKIYTSIITIQEVSVLSFRAGQIYDDNHARVNKLARIQTITREIALTAAKLEANVIDLTQRRTGLTTAAANGTASISPRQCNSVVAPSTQSTRA